MAKTPARYPDSATATILLREGRLVVESDDGTVDSVRIAASGTLTFRTPGDGPLQWWSILWKSDTPFQDRRGWASEARGKGKGKRIAANANGGGNGERRYEYAVVASDGSKVYFEDPEVVVGPEEPG